MTNPGPPQGSDGRPGQQSWSSQPEHQLRAENQPWAERAAPPQPQDQSGPSSARPPGGAGRLIAGIAIGLVAAVAVGAVLVSTKVIAFGSAPGAAVDRTAIELPAELADLRDQAAVVAEKAPERNIPEQQRLQKTYDLTTQWYQRAFDGAGVGVRTYADDELTLFPTVIAVRAATPGLFSGPVADPAYLKLEAGAGLFDRVVEGGVECLATHAQAVPEGNEVDPEDQLTTLCRRAINDLTVYVHGHARGPEGRQQMIALADAAFEAVDGTTS